MPYDGLTFKQNPLDRSFNVVVNQMASRLFPRGFDVVPDAPDTLDKLIALVDSCGRFKVWNGASDKTIFDCAETNYAFRAWHDWCHWKYGFGFDKQGETLALEMQKSHVVKLYGNGPDSKRWLAILEAEVIGQLEYLEDHGKFPDDQREVTRRYLAVRGWQFAHDWNPTTAPAKVPEGWAFV